MSATTNTGSTAPNSSETTLTDFLLARIADDEADVCAMAGLNRDGSMDFESHTDGYAVSGRMERVAARVLAECEAKRRIVEVHAHDYKWSVEHAGELAKMTIELLALPYADHEDYREEWKP